MPQPDTFPLLDDFTQANGAIDGRTASSGYIWKSPFVSTHVAGQIASNAFAGAAGQDRDAVLQGRWGPDVTVGARISTLGSALFLVARIQQTTFPVSSTVRDYFSARATINAGADDDTLVISITVGSTITTLATFNLNDDWAVGDEFGMSLTETPTSTLYEGWRKPFGGVWTTVGSSSTVNATRPKGAGAIGLEIDGTIGALDDLRGGTTYAADAAPMGIGGRGAGW